MSKAEERAFERCPKSENVIEEMRNERKRAIFTEGYHQAEKDLELTWKDMELIYEISCDVFNEQDGCFYDLSKIWKETLKRFKERKEPC